MASQANHVAAMVDPTSRSHPSTPWSTSEPTDELTKDRDRLLRHDLQGQDATLLGWIGGKDLFHLEALCELHQNSSNIRPLESRGVIGVLLP